MVLLAKPADGTQSEKETSKSKVSSLWSPFLYMLIENGHNFTILVLAPISFFNRHFTCHTLPIKIVYE